MSVSLLDLLRSFLTGDQSEWVSIYGCNDHNWIYDHNDDLDKISIDLDLLDHNDNLLCGQWLGWSIQFDWKRYKLKVFRAESSKEWI